MTNNEDLDPYEVAVADTLAELGITFPAATVSELEQADKAPIVEHIRRLQGEHGEAWEQAFRLAYDLGD